MMGNFLTQFFSFLTLARLCLLLFYCFYEILATPLCSRSFLWSVMALVLQIHSLFFFEDRVSSSQI